MALVAVHRNAVVRSRALKPEIPLSGDHGIPIRDEIELERIVNEEATAAMGSLIQIGPDMIEAASDVLARAFFDDPMTVFIIPDASRRPAILPALYSAAIAQARSSGSAYTTETLDAVALWVPPEAAGMTPDQALLTAETLAAQMQAEERGRVAGLVEQLEGLRQRCAPSAHWYLDILGVDPPRQGQGIGGRMLEPILLRADTSGVHCYLETFKERNLPFYEKHGFVALAEEQIRHGPRFWPMLRKPRFEML